MRNIIGGRHRISAESRQRHSTKTEFKRHKKKDVQKPAGMRECDCVCEWKRFLLALLYNFIM